MSEESDFENNRIDISLRPSIWRRADPAQRRDLEAIMKELQTTSTFELEVEAPEGGWGIRLGLTAEHLIIGLVDTAGIGFASRSITLEPLRSLIRSYLLLISRMGDAISSHSMVHLEALDMARRSTHNEASAQVQDALDGFLKVDLETARRLFTVLCLVYDTPVR